MRLNRERAFGNGQLVGEQLLKEAGVTIYEVFPKADLELGYFLHPKYTKPTLNYDKCTQQGR